jgi:hypothetical protein
MPRKKNIVSSNNVTNGKDELAEKNRAVKNTYDILMEDDPISDQDSEQNNNHTEQSVKTVPKNNKSSNNDSNDSDDGFQVATTKNRKNRINSDDLKKSDRNEFNRKKTDRKKSDPKDSDKKSDRDCKRKDIVSRSKENKPIHRSIERDCSNTNDEPADEPADEQADDRMDCPRKKPEENLKDETIEDLVEPVEPVEPVQPVDRVVSKYVPPTVSENLTKGWISGNTRRRRGRDDHDQSAPKDGSDGTPKTILAKKELSKKELLKKDDELEYYDHTTKLKGDDMKLNTTWNVWIHENSNPNWDIKSYTSICSIDSIGSMWRFLSVLDNLDKNVRQYYIMRDGITPIWEDNNNKQGAICSIMVDNMSRSRYNKGDIGVDAFSAICILVMNESFVKNNLDINGLCYSIKSRSVLIKLWVKDYENNKNFMDKLPITILKSLDTIISTIENKGNYGKSNGGKSRISVQVKQIKPNY